MCVCVCCVTRAEGAGKEEEEVRGEAGRKAGSARHAVNDCKRVAENQAGIRPWCHGGKPNQTRISSTSFSTFLLCSSPPRYFSLVLLSQRHSLKITWCPTLPGLNRGRERRWGCASEFSSLSESRRRRRENRLIFLLLLPLAISQMGFHTLPSRNSGLLGPLCWKWLTWPT